MGKANVRIVASEDLEVLRSLQLECLPGDVPIVGGYWWVAYDIGGSPVAFCCLKIEAPYGYIARVGVVPDMRGWRLQRKMQFVAERKARLLGCTHMVSDTAAWNHPSSNTFIGMGYKLYTPAHPWGWSDGLYWIKKL